MNVKQLIILMKFLLLGGGPGAGVGGVTEQTLKRNEQKTAILFFLSLFKYLSTMVFASGWIYLGIKTSYCTVVFVNDTDSSVVEKMLEHLVLH